MKIILNEKVTKLGNIGDIVEVATGYARNYLLPKGKATRYSKENAAVFESQKAVLIKKQEDSKKQAQSQVESVAGAKFHMIRQAGDTGHLYGSVSSRDIAHMLNDLTGIAIESNQVMMGAPIKSIGAFDTKIALHPDVIVPIKIYVAQTQDEIDALVAGKVLEFNTKKADAEEQLEGQLEEQIEEKTAKKPAKAKKEEKTEDKTEEAAPEKKVSKRVKKD